MNDMTMRRYSLAHSQRVVPALGVAALMLGFGFWAIFIQVDDDTPGWYQLIFWLVWCAVILFIVFRTLTSTREIVVHDNDEIEFVSALERERMPACEIRSVKVLKSEDIEIVVHHSSGKTYLAGPMNDFHQFLGELRQTNPDVELIGC